MTPEEAEQAITAGYSFDLMLDWRSRTIINDLVKKVFLLYPAVIGYGGGKIAPPETNLTKYDPPSNSFAAGSFRHVRGKGQCVFLKSGKCEIHISGFKPTECRASFCDVSRGTDPKKIASEIVRSWESLEAKAVIERWKRITHLHELVA